MSSESVAKNIGPVVLLAVLIIVSYLYYDKDPDVSFITLVVGLFLTFVYVASMIASETRKPKK